MWPCRAQTPKLVPEWPGGMSLTDDAFPESGLSPVKRTTMADQVFADIKELILTGGIAPGQRITLRRLAEVVGTSPMPVRDAVSRLIAENALEMLPNRSIQVVFPSVERFQELVTIRSTVEGLAVETAAQRRTAKEVTRIRRYAELFEKYAQGPNPNPREAMLANRKLHFAIYSAARMPCLLRIIEGLWLQVGPVYWNAVTREIERNAEAKKSGTGEAGRNQMLIETRGAHFDMVDGIEERDPEKARHALRQDIERAGRLIVAFGGLKSG